MTPVSSWADLSALAHRDATSGSLPVFTRIPCGDFAVSIQGGRYNYSTPRRDLPTLAEYSAVEVAVFTAAGEWVAPHNVPELAPMAARLNFEHGESSVAGGVSSEEAVELFNVLLTVKL